MKYLDKKREELNLEKKLQKDILLENLNVCRVDTKHT